MPASVFPFGVTIHDKEAAHDCHVLYEGRGGESYLINMEGENVRTWPFTGFPAEMIDPAINGGKKGHILCQREPDTFQNKALLEVDWDGNVVWEWGSNAPEGEARQNHDLHRLADGNTLLISKRMYNRPDLHDKPFMDQPIYEVTPAGDIVWDWVAHDHFEALGITGEKREVLFSDTQVRGRAYIFVINNMQPLGPNRWHDAGDDRFHPDNIMVDSREANFIAIIDKKSGDVVWRLGPDYPAAFDFSKRAFNGPVPRPVDSISGQHDAHMIAQQLPGGGNILVFDNDGPAGLPQVYSKTFPGSRVLEIDPITRDIVWQYDGSSSGMPFWAFYSSFISSARRLPNGNTLICEGMTGRIFQVTVEGEIVWEFMNPKFGEWSQHQMNLINFGGSQANWVFRAQHVPNAWLPDSVQGPVSGS